MAGSVRKLLFRTLTEGMTGKSIGRMNVIHLVTNKVWGGGERYVLDLAKMSMESEINVRILARPVKAVTDKFLEAGIALDTARFGGITDITTPRRLAAITDECALSGPVILHAHDFKTALTAIRAKRLSQVPGKVRIVVTRHLVRKAKTDLLHRFIYRNVDAIIFVSECARNAFFSGFIGEKHSKSRHEAEERSQVIHNSIANVPRRPAFSSGNENEPHRPPVLCFVGRIVPEKGVELLLKALGGLRSEEWFLKVGGTGNPEYLDLLKSQASELGISDKVEWLGYQEDIWQVMGSADIGVIPSVVPESFGLTILEFMNMGVPVVSTSGGAQGEIIRNGRDGILVEPEESALRGALAELIASPAKRRDMGKAALERAADFSYDVFWERISGVYKALVSTL